MKHITFLTTAFVVLFLASCVQKSAKKTITLRLHTSGVKNIQAVGVRGSDKPLSWDYDLELKPIVKDSLYTTTFSLTTGYTFTEAKFTVNGQFELGEKGNRRIVFGDKESVVYEATYNVEQ